MFRFEAMDGCSICNSMEGLYEEEPERPHAYCRCVISEVDEDDGNDTDDDDTDLTRSTSGSPGSVNRTGDGWSFRDSEDGVLHMEIVDGEEVWSFGGVLEVYCCDGKSGASYDYTLEFSVDPAERDGDWVEALEQALLEAEANIDEDAAELRDDECEPCDHIV